MRRAKIVCTLGPSSLSQDKLEELLTAGMDVARLNFSHGSHQQHAESIERLRTASLKVRKGVALLADLAGPKIRTGVVEKGGIVLKDGASLRITTDEGVEGKEGIVSTNYQYLPADVNPGDRILLDDGLLELKVRSTDRKQTVETEVITGGLLKSHKGLNLPGIALRGDALTPKDLEDLAFAVASGVDYLGLSFVRQPGDIDQARAAMARIGRQIPIIAKLEKPEALARLDAILDNTDGVMIARGDLGVEIPPEEVPAIQKDIIRRSNSRGIPVIVATQMLNSMIDHPRPRRRVLSAQPALGDARAGEDSRLLPGYHLRHRLPRRAGNRSNGDCVLHC